MRKLVTTIDDVKVEVFVDGTKITLDDTTYQILKKGDLTYIHNGTEEVQIDDIIDQGNGNYRIEIRGYTIDVQVVNPLDMLVKGSAEESGIIKTPLTGVISKIFVKEGEEVSKDDVLLTISAMKMENKIIAKVNGRVKSINVNIGDQVNTGSTLLELEPQ